MPLAGVLRRAGRRCRRRRRPRKPAPAGPSSRRSSTGACGGPGGRRAAAATRVTDMRGSAYAPSPRDQPDDSTTSGRASGPEDTPTCQRRLDVDAALDQQARVRLDARVGQATGGPGSAPRSENSRRVSSSVRSLGGIDDVRRRQVVVGSALAARADERPPSRRGERRAPSRRPRSSARDRLVVELVELAVQRRRRPGTGPSPISRTIMLQLLLLSPAPSSAFIFASSASTWVCGRELRELAVELGLVAA